MNKEDDLDEAENVLESPFDSREKNISSNTAANTKGLESNLTGKKRPHEQQFEEDGEDDEDDDGTIKRLKMYDEKDMQSSEYIERERRSSSEVGMFGKSKKQHDDSLEAMKRKSV